MKNTMAVANERRTPVSLEERDRSCEQDREEDRDAEQDEVRRGSTHARTSRRPAATTTATVTTIVRSGDLVVLRGLEHAGGERLGTPRRRRPSSSSTEDSIAPGAVAIVTGSRPC